MSMTLSRCSTSFFVFAYTSMSLTHLSTRSLRLLSHTKCPTSLWNLPRVPIHLRRQIPSHSMTLNRNQESLPMKSANNGFSVMKLTEKEGFPGTNLSGLWIAINLLAITFRSWVERLVSNSENTANCSVRYHRWSSNNSWWWKTTQKQKRIKFENEDLFQYTFCSIIHPVMEHWIQVIE